MWQVTYFSVWVSSCFLTFVFLMSSLSCPMKLDIDNDMEILCWSCVNYVNIFGEGYFLFNSQCVFVGKIIPLTFQSCQVSFILLHVQQLHSRDTPPPPHVLQDSWMQLFIQLFREPIFYLCNICKCLLELNSVISTSSLWDCDFFVATVYAKLDWLLKLLCVKISLKYTDLRKHNQWVCSHSVCRTFILVQYIHSIFYYAQV